MYDECHVVTCSGTLLRGDDIEIFRIPVHLGPLWPTTLLESEVEGIGEIVSLSLGETSFLLAQKYSNLLYG